MQEIYLDNNSTTKIAPEVLKAMRPFLGVRYGNPSSEHRLGKEAERAVEDSRQTVAGFLGTDKREIIFTSGATESNNLALLGAARTRKHAGKHIITTLVEHDSVLEPCQKLEAEGFFVTYLEPDRWGRIFVEEAVAALREDTVLAAIMHVQNELGTIYPINEMAHELKKRKSDILFFSDGAQAFGKLPIGLDWVDLYSISAHKMHGPKGVGALYVRSGVELESMMFGGGQERKLRPGTENVPAIVGFAKAAQLAYANLEKNRAHLYKLRNQFLADIRNIKNAVVNSPDDGLETTINIAFPGIASEVLLRALEEKGVYASAGSACSIRKSGVSHVLEALPVDKEIAHASIRFGLSRYNAEEEIGYTVKTIGEIISSWPKTSS